MILYIKSQKALVILLVRDQSKHLDVVDDGNIQCTVFSLFELTSRIE